MYWWNLIKFILLLMYFYWKYIIKWYDKYAMNYTIFYTIFIRFFIFWNFCFEILKKWSFHFLFSKISKNKKSYKYRIKNRIVHCVFIVSILLNNINKYWNNNYIFYTILSINQCENVIVYNYYNSILFYCIFKQ